MIYGIGIDLLHIERMQRAYTRHSIRFVERILSSVEQEDWQRILPHQQSRWLAKRWAAKEALAKATGLGMRDPVTWQNMSIRHTEQGQPIWQFHHQLAEWIDEKKLIAHLSLSDERDTVIAYVILEKAI
jgi:holo-[acyl-carrier protein] synthase